MRVGTRIIIDPQLRELIPPLHDEDGQFATPIEKTAATERDFEHKAAELLETHPDEARAVPEVRRTAADVVRELRHQDQAGQAAGGMGERVVVRLRR